MTTIKSYTDVAQSKTLSNILPFESADGTWVERTNLEVKYSHSELPFWLYGGLGIPSWSLAALLDVLPILDNRSPVIPKTFDGKYRVTYHSTAYEKAILTSDYDNPIDACVAMIEKLHELNLL